MDNLDKKLLFELQLDCNQQINKLMWKTDSPQTTIYNRIKKLEELGIISGYHAQVDHKKLGFSTNAFVFVSLAHQALEKHSYHDIVDHIRLLPHVLEIHHVSGDWSLLLKVVAKDNQDLGNFISSHLRRIPGVERTKTLITFDSFVDHRPLKPI